MAKFLIISTNIITIASALSARVYSMPELVVHLCDALVRPPHQTIFALMVFKQLGFLTDDGGSAVRLVRSGFRQLDESGVYSCVAEAQRMG